MAKWVVDNAHSAVEFTVKHMMITTVRGSFNDYTAMIDFDPANPAASSVEATIQVASIDSGTNDRDNHLRSADFFEVETYPKMTFKSTGVEMQGDQVAKVTGDLTIRDVTRPVTLDVTYLGQGQSLFGFPVVGFEASTKINREDFGLTWNQTLETGGVLVSRDVKILLDIQAMPAQGEAEGDVAGEAVN